MRAALLLAIVIAANIAPEPGQIGAHYFDTLDQSQVWINLEPTNLEPGPNPIQFNATVSFPGHTLAAAPASVDLRVEAYCQLFPTRIRQPVFTLTVNGVLLSLIGSEQTLQVNSACGDNKGRADVIVTRVPFEGFQRMTAASEVTVHALSFDARLTPSDMGALRSFAATVAAGVTVK